MKYAKAKMFNKKASNPNNKAFQILKTLNLHPGATVADIGAGGGYFSLLFAEAVGKKGRVYAIDTNEESVEFIKKSAAEKKLDNIKALLTTENTVVSDVKNVDVLFFRNVYHHLSNRVEYFSHVKDVLRPDGKIAIVEHKQSGNIFSFHRVFGHYVHKETIIKDMDDAGYHLTDDYDFLSQQSFMIFEKNKQKKHESEARGTRANKNREHLMVL